jgi:uncharacterized membrane protein (UPF0127 family)
MVFFHRAQAFNQTRQVYLATALAIADTHWTRLVGLLGVSAGDFRNGCGLWIAPCRGVHTLAMQFPIDVVYLDRGLTVIHTENSLQPWRFAAVKLKAESVLELPSQTVNATGTGVGDKIAVTFLQENQ